MASVLPHQFLYMLQRFWLIFLLSFVLLPAGGSAPMAQTVNDFKRPVLITAEKLSQDRQRGVIVATGNVRITQGDRTVRADRLIYDERNGQVTAFGNVSIIEPRGEVVFGRRVKLSGDLRDGTIEHFRMLFPDNTRIAATDARRYAGRRTEMAKVVFSPCKLCEEDPTKPNLWRIKARKVIHDGEAQNIEYHDAWMEVYGIPVFYTPILSHPDPTVYSRSGFIVPEIGARKPLGTWIKLPYYWRIGEDSDATLTPLISSQQNPVLFAEYRRRYKKGAAIIAGSHTYARRLDTDVRPILQGQSRGHLFSKIRYDVDSNWRFGANANWTTDDTFLRLYDVSSADSLQSSVWLEGFHNRDYTQLRIHHFQGLREGDNYRATPLVAPYAELERIGSPEQRLGRWHFRFSTANLTRWEGTDSYRASVNLGWRLPYIHKPTGITFAATLDVHADGYYLAESRRPDASQFTGFSNRVYPIAELDIRYPFVRELGNVRAIVEPRISLISTFRGLNDPIIPNEDSVDIEVDDANLFLANRFPGRDRVDEGSRLIYGFNTVFLGNRGGQSELFLGQSLELGSSREFEPASGVQGSFSDLVGRLRVNPGRYLDLVYRFRIHPDEIEPKRNEVGIFAGVPALSLSFSYLNVRRRGMTVELPTRDELSFTTRSQVTKTWSVFGGGRWNLAEAAGNLNWQLGGQFKNECCTLRVTGGQSYVRDRDIRPSTYVLFRLSLKHLGEIGD
ncbi:MAG: LPS-assembly protein LptD [Rhodospirillaceae bacterium]|nr:LPS-assembly protein LptD [Rhodospirillaceae bacterium]MYB13451.1 LPS-assembly protein LptD [Rhodospirillaceae bacterium]